MTVHHDPYHGYETEPIGDGNPYYRCIHCHRSDPEINGRLEGHTLDCEYRRSVEEGREYRPFDEDGRPNVSI